MNKNINVISPINPLGYGVAGLNIVKELHIDNNVCLWPMGQPQVTSQEDMMCIAKLVNNSHRFDYNAPCLKIWHQHDMAQFVGKGKHIGFPFFELDEFNDQEKHSLNSLDQIFVTCDWAKEIIQSETSVKDIQVVPLGVDTKIFKPVDFEEKEKTIFLNCGKWEVRKGHDILSELFNDAFEEKDDVELWVMSHNPFLSETEEKEWHNLYLNSKLSEKIKLVPRVKTHEEVYNIMAHADCGIFPSRAEGWNLELLEMLACGKQVITTDYSAHSAFCNNDNAFLVEITDKETAFDGKWFNGKYGNWAKLGDKQKESFVEHLRYVHKNKKYNGKGVETAEKFNWSNSAKSIIKHV